MREFMKKCYQALNVITPLPPGMNPALESKPLGKELVRSLEGVSGK